MAEKNLAQQQPRNGPERPGTGRNKRLRVLGDHPRHFLGPQGVWNGLERPGTVWNGTLALRDASVGGQQAGRAKSASGRKILKIEVKNFEKMKKWKFKIFKYDVSTLFLYSLGHSGVSESLSSGLESMFSPEKICCDEILIMSHHLNRYRKLCNRVLNKSWATDITWAEAL